MSLAVLWAYALCADQLRDFSGSVNSSIARKGSCFLNSKCEGDHDAGMTLRECLRTGGSIECDGLSVTT